VDSVPDPQLIRKSGSAGNRSRTSGSVARNYDYYKTEEVVDMLPPTFVKHLEAPVETIFEYLFQCCAFVAFEGTSTALPNHCPLRTCFSREDRKKSAVTSLGNMLQSRHIVLDRIIFYHKRSACKFIVVQKKLAVQIFVKKTVNASN
jgi:hypothetical protein